MSVYEFYMWVLVEPGMSWKSQILFFFLKICNFQLNFVFNWPQADSHVKTQSESCKMLCSNVILTSHCGFCWHYSTSYEIQKFKNLIFLNFSQIQCFYESLKCFSYNKTIEKLRYCLLKWYFRSTLWVLCHIIVYHVRPKFWIFEKFNKSFFFCNFTVVFQRYRHSADDTLNF